LRSSSADKDLCGTVIASKLFIADWVNKDEDFFALAETQDKMQKKVIVITGSLPKMPESAKL
jgi:hypothetical protein